MIISALVKINNNELIKYYSNSNKKIKCNEDDNIYPSVYVAKDSTYTFSETDIPLNEISASTIINAASVVGLSDYVLNTLDLMDEKDDETIAIDLGGA